MFTLNNIVIWVGTIVILVSFIMALKLRKSEIKYMRRIYIAPMIGLMGSTNSVLGNFFSMYSSELLYIIQNILFITLLLFWFSFFSVLLTEKLEKKKLNIVLFITLGIQILLLLFGNDDKQNLHVAAISTVCISTFCILFYYNLIKHLYYQDILKEPAFWIVTGLIFASALSIPFYGLNSYIKMQFSPNIASGIFSISNMLIIIMHLFFIKAYLCINQAHKE